MANYQMGDVLRSACADRAYWQERFELAIESDDRDGAAAALRMWRRYQWFINWIEGRADAAE